MFSKITDDESEFGHAVIHLVAERPEQLRLVRASMGGQDVLVLAFEQTMDDVGGFALIPLAVMVYGPMANEVVPFWADDEAAAASGITTVSRATRDLVSGLEALLRDGAQP